VDILLTFLFGAAVVTALMLSHFEEAPDVRTAVVGPPVFAVIGALLGISMGMMWLWGDAATSWQGRISIGQGVAHALAGAAIGGVVGIGAKAIFARFSRTRVIGVVLTLMLLAASIGAPAGWLYGDVSVRNAGEAEQLTRSGMMWGSGIGCFVGFAIGLFEVCFGGRFPKGATTIPNAENAVS
jgi:hypothetical protein